MSGPVHVTYPLADFRVTREVDTSTLVDVDAPPDVVKGMQRVMEELTWATMLGGRPHTPPRTALRLAPGGRSFDTVKLDAAGNIIEPPPRCHCTVVHHAGCPNRFLAHT